MRFQDLLIMLQNIVIFNTKNWKIFISLAGAISTPQLPDY